MKSIINALKDAALAPVARWIINKYNHNLRKLGEMTILRLDCQKQQLSMAFDLRGEQTPIELTLHYHVQSPSVIEITEVHSSREWITTLANDIISAKSKQIEVPAFVTAALSKIIQ
jgi:metal-responsive CopG/Arc/MetJ family transcriptional regulator